MVLRLKRDILKAQPHVRIIGVSVNDQPGYARNMIQLGAKGYVTKNSSKEEMIKAIKEVFEGKTYICKEVKDKLGNPNKVYINKWLVCRL